MYLDSTLRQALRMVPGGGALWTLGAVSASSPRVPMLILKLPLLRPAWQSAPIGVGETRLYGYDAPPAGEGPVVRSIWRIYDKGVGQPPLILDAWLDPGDPQQRALLEALTRVETVQLHAFHASPALPYLGSKLLRWHAQHQEGVRAVLAATVGCATRFAAARARAEREAPIATLGDPVDGDE